MSRFRTIALGLPFFLLSACSPACTPPEASPPDGGPTEKAQADGTAKPSEGKPSPTPGQADMIQEAPGVNLSDLAESQRSTFFQIINTEPSACDKPHSIAASLRDDSTCRDSLIVAQFAADRLKEGVTPSAAKEQIAFVTASLQPRDITVENRPTYGSERAPVTVVVFSDFQCPHCRDEAPALRRAVDQFRGRAKLVYKHFPLAGHPQAKEAAVATEAALEQGKFWEMHDLVFASQDNLDSGRLRSFAKKIGLDMAGYDASYKARKGEAAVVADKADGEELGIEGTPAVFVNGRAVNSLLFGGTVVGWIDDALKR